MVSCQSLRRDTLGKISGGSRVKTNFHGFGGKIAFTALRSIQSEELSPSASIEVEKKFQPPSIRELEELVKQHGGQELGKVAFTDLYYDDAEYSLVSTDTWLRRRDDTWELKVPVGTEEEYRSGDERAVFREVEGEASVMEALTEYVAGLDSSRPLAEALQACNFTAFAEFHTIRQKWSLSGCTIDLDVADFGYSIMEIEAMCGSEDDVPGALENVERVAELLNAQPLTSGHGGKLVTYIRNFCPQVLARLVQAGILHG
ncbi:hypothetical protein CYMTET_36653 [Cymbomonas tetramitiformis]|uniref:CYTH domain-containing protein n=1 Tax=Cymbomonas tetramitiformis TaxID=36881 RepID=A0AAE0F7T0_9CHLO|nr:hypothetical protein CYMTET_36653 [Cymbomonas tetramitiformis]